MHPSLAIAATAWLVLVSLASAPASGAEPAGDLPRVIDIRLGSHRIFDRIVLELEGEAEVVVRETAPDYPLVIEIGARPLLASQTLDGGLERTGRIEIERTAAGMRLRVEARPRRVRVFALVEPPRVVIDFASPGEDPFTPPEGTRAIEPLPEAAELLEAVAEPVEPLTNGEEVGTAPEQAEPVAEPMTEPITEPSMPEEAPNPPRVAPELGPLAPEPAAGTESAEAPAPVALPLAPAPPAVPEAAAAPQGRGWPEVPGGPLGLLVGGVGSVFAVLIVLGLLRRGRVREPDPQLTRQMEYPADRIAPAELEALAGDPVELLTRRLDEEVRLRFELEERMGELREEIKVLRDRARRLGRAERGVG